MTSIDNLESACPVGWHVQSGNANEFVIRTEQLRSPHGLEIQVECLTYTGQAVIRLDSFVDKELRSRIESTYQAIKENGWPRISSNGWEMRLSQISRVSDEVPVKFEIRDPDGLIVNGQPSTLQDVLQVVGEFLRLALKIVEPRKLNDELDETTESGLPEGGQSRVIVNRYERDPRNRAAAIAIHGSSCLVCGFDFGAEYGDIADGFIHIHHLTPVSQMGTNYMVNPRTDLVPLCPNCHAAAHRRNPPLSIDELKEVRSRNHRIQ